MTYLSERISTHKFFEDWIRSLTSWPINKRLYISCSSDVKAAIMLMPSDFFPTYQMNTFVIIISPNEIAGCFVDMVSQILWGSLITCINVSWHYYYFFLFSKHIQNLYNLIILSFKLTEINHLTREQYMSLIHKRNIEQILVTDT